MSPGLAAACCVPIDTLPDPALFKALCDPTRVLLPACLARCGRACCVIEVAARCAVVLSAVSRHLSIPGRARVLRAEKGGRTVLYAAHYDHFCQRLRALASAFNDCCRTATAAGDIGCEKH